MKRADIKLGESYAKASPHYGKTSYGSVDLHAHKVLVVDARKWNYSGGSSWFHNHSSYQEFKLEHGETVRLPACCYAVDLPTHGYGVNGVLVKTEAGDYIVAPLNQLRLTWAEHEQNVNDEKLRQDRIRAAEAQEQEVSKTRFETMERLAKRIGIPGKVAGKRGTDNWARYDDPTFVLSFFEFMDLAAKMGEVILVPPAKEDQS